MGGHKAWVQFKTEAEFRRALRRNPDDLPTLHRYALFLYNRKKDTRQAEDMFVRCLRVSEDYAEALVDYGLMCWLRWKMEDADRRDVQDKHNAERMLRKAVKLTSGPGRLHARACSKLALFLDEALGRAEEALLYFQRAAESDGVTPDHAYNLGVHLEEAGRVGEAVEWYKAAITASPGHAAALSNYARLLYSHVRDRDLALQYHQRAVRAAPNDPDVCFNFATFQVPLPASPALPPARRPRSPLTSASTWPPSSPWLYPQPWALPPPPLAPPLASICSALWPAYPPGPMSSGPHIVEGLMLSRLVIILRASYRRG